MQRKDGKINCFYNHTLDIRDSLKKNYPFLVCHSVGKSICGRDIMAYSIGNYKNIVLFAGGFRGQDCMLCLLLYRYLEKLCEAVKNKSKLAGVNIYSSLVSKGVTVIPCINPDAIEIYLCGKESAGEYSEYVNILSKGNFSNWNSNAKGIDISRNFSVGREKLRTVENEKGIFGPSPSGYGGFAPESESETVALVKFCERNNIHHAFSLMNGEKGIMWDYEGDVPENSRTMAKVLSVCCGYELFDYKGRDTSGSFKDWFIKNFSRSAFTVEFDKRKTGTLPSEIDELYSSVEEMLVIGTII